VKNKKLIVKNIFDYVVAIILTIILLPLLAFIALLVMVFIGRPFIFKQARPGLHGEPFIIYKFRTMTEELDENGILLPDNHRLGLFGRLLRSSSLDELPALFNILKGDISLVGPRPLLMRYLSRYTSEQSRRHEVKPGITGWAQINGRNAISWEQKFKFDVWYVDNHTFWLDLKIIFLTAVKVLKREGISQKGIVTMEEFRGLKK